MQQNLVVAEPLLCVDGAEHAENKPGCERKIGGPVRVVVSQDRGPEAHPR